MSLSNTSLTKGFALNSWELYQTMSSLQTVDNNQPYSIEDISLPSISSIEHIIESLERELNDIMQKNQGEATTPGLYYRLLAKLKDIEPDPSNNNIEACRLYGKIYLSLGYCLIYQNHSNLSVITKTLECSKRCFFLIGDTSYNIQLSFLSGSLYMMQGEFEKATAFFLVPLNFKIFGSQVITNLEICFPKISGQQQEQIFNIIENVMVADFNKGKFDTTYLQYYQRLSNINAPMFHNQYLFLTVLKTYKEYFFILNSPDQFIRERLEKFNKLTIQQNFENLLPVAAQQNNIIGACIISKLLLNLTQTNLSLKQRWNNEYLYYLIFIQKMNQREILKSLFERYQI